jgi:uncharacterized tellurite resistance protein B-like protein
MIFTTNIIMSKREIMQTNETLTFKLAKLMIAVSWADGDFHISELNALKNLLFALPELTTREWAELEIYMDSPVKESERKMLLNDVIDAIGSRSKKKQVLQTLKMLLEVDGSVTESEQAVFIELKEAIEFKQTGLLGLFSNLTGGILKKRMNVEREARTRENQLEDFLRNKILYDLKMNYPGFSQIPEIRLKKICSAAALLGRVAITDGDFSAGEKEAMVSVLVSEWNLTESEARVLMEIVQNRVSDGIDYHYLTHSFFEQTTSEERSQFIKCLFQIANASEKTSYHEIEEIRQIAKYLKVSHSDFIEAKLTIPRVDRNGL